MKSMSRADLNNWRELIRDTIDAAVQCGMQKEVRGLFVGISAVFYAADACGCAEKILPKYKFLAHLERKINETLQKHSPYSANNQEGTGS